MPLPRGLRRAVDGRQANPSLLRDGRQGLAGRHLRLQLLDSQPQPLCDHRLRLRGLAGRRAVGTSRLHEGGPMAAPVART
jgi:hypothetical protein